jgi:hypothetical protein
MDKMSSTTPAGMKLIEVNGSSRLLEVPLHLSHDLSLKNNRRVFSSAGVSSFILTEENNKYNTMLNGIEGKMVGNYTKDMVYLAGAFDLALGYEKDLGKKNHIRIQSYLQLPIRGIGIGQLRVKTAGFKVGLTRSR